jgi:hypothetical protein
MLRLSALLTICSMLYLIIPVSAQPDDHQNYNLCKMIERHNGWTGSSRACSDKSSNFGNLARICMEAQGPDCEPLMLDLTSCMNSLGYSQTCRRGAFVENGHSRYIAFDFPAKRRLRSKGDHPGELAPRVPIVQPGTPAVAPTKEEERSNPDLPIFPFCTERGGGWMEAIDYLKWNGGKRVHDVRFVSPPTSPTPIESVPEIGTTLIFDDRNPAQLLLGAAPCVQSRCTASTTAETGSFRIARRLSYPSQEGLARTWQLCVVKESK